MNMNLTELHREFIRECRFSSRLSDETIKSYEQRFKSLMDLMPGLTPETIIPKNLTLFFERLHNRERIVGRGIVKKGVKKSTIATYRSKLSKFFKWLEKKGHIQRNPFLDMEYPSVKYEDRKFLDKEQVGKIFTSVVMYNWPNQMVATRNLLILSLLLYCGLRKGELIGLRVCDIDIRRRVLKVRSETSKSEVARYVPIQHSLIKLLEDYFVERRRVNLNVPELLISNNKEQALTKHGLKHFVSKLNTISGTKFHLHQFRHTFAVNMLNMGCDVAKLQQLMGHKDIRMTSVYLRCLPTNSMRADVESLSIDGLL